MHVCRVSSSGCIRRPEPARTIQLGPIRQRLRWRDTRRLARRIRRQKLQRAQNGVKNQDARARSATDEIGRLCRKAAVLTELLERRAAGESIASLVRWLNASRVRSTEGNVGKWAYSTFVR